MFYGHHQKRLSARRSAGIFSLYSTWHPTTLFASPLKLRKARRTLLLFSLVTILSWLPATNHCAIAREITRPAAHDSAPPGHEHCPKSDGKDDGQSQMTCCWALKASVNPAQSLVSYDASLFILKFWFMPEFLQSDFGSEASQAWHWDHGPPKVPSFAEQVLQRSILSNAPPVLS